MPIDFDALRGEGGEPELPEDGDHVAVLERAAIVDTRNGERLVTEWRDAVVGQITWQSWNRFDTTGMSYTRELMIGLGVDLSAVTDTDALEQGLYERVNGMYSVRTTSQMGSGGDRIFITTYVNGAVNGAQQTLATDVPIDTEGLPPVRPAPPRAPAQTAAPAAAPAAQPGWKDDKPPF